MNLPLQVIADWAPPHWRAIDLRDLESAEREAAVARIAREERSRPFDLERGPLLNLSLLGLES